jgi:hypothetical protein
MNEASVAIFRTYPFQIGQKIHIEDGPRRGDWEVIGLSGGKVTLRCPVSGREFEWNRFCYLIEEESRRPWPQPD